MNPKVAAVSRDDKHRFSKKNVGRIRLVEELGVEGDAHKGTTVQHRSRVAKDPSAPNLRQVHLIHEELFAEMAALGYAVRAGDLGENITTRGLDVLALPRGARLHIGQSAIVEITGLRNPCVQIDRFAPGLMQAMLGRDEQGKLTRKCGVMGVVLAGGEVLIGDELRVELPPHPHEALQVV
ncbi:MAG TPA: MOSC domain-containing protein [Thermoflexales bacterium]|nr:MOSC domain-containing protein [Thermoflexales bacterium]HRA00836.1 MOSC domain-containing protein [Thermoflexales bacterium]